MDRQTYIRTDIQTDGRTNLHCRFEVGGLLLQPERDALDVEENHLTLCAVVDDHGQDHRVEHHPPQQLDRKQSPMDIGAETGSVK